MSERLIEHFRMFAEYNRLANETLYAACAQLSDGERKLCRPAFFDSIHGTLNHIMVGDRIWLARFEGQSVPSTGLDAILYEASMTSGTRAKPKTRGSRHSPPR